MRILISLISVICTFSSFAQPGTDIYLFDMKITQTGISLSNPVNITHRKGYDNQPFFAPNRSLIYYTSAKDTLGNTEIKTYDYVSKKTNFFTNTPEGEYSPTVTPDQKYISCILGRNVGKKNVTQYLVKYPISGGSATILIDNMVVGYHTWIDKNRLMLFVLGDTGQNALHYFNIKTRQDRILMYNPGRTLQKIPGEDAVGFIDKSDSNNIIIKKIFTNSLKNQFVSKTVGKSEFVTWIKKDLLIMSDGKDLFINQLSVNKGWQKIAYNNETFLLKGITRLAVNSNYTKLAIVAAE